MIRKIFHNLQLILITGKSPQSFLDASWIPKYLHLFKGNKAKYKALKILALSPHYYYKKLQEKHLSKKQFIFREHRRNHSSRIIIKKQLLDQYLKPDMQVIDYGCGPSYLAKLVSFDVKELYALDISDGVLSCAKTINGRENMTFLNVFKDDVHQKIHDKSIDLIYSFAVFQHIREQYIPDIFKMFSKLIKDDGIIIMHVIVNDNSLKTEDEWKNDHSFIGKSKYKFGLNCFSRDENYYIDLLKENGFSDIKCEKASSFFNYNFDDIYGQNIIIVTK